MRRNTMENSFLTIQQRDFLKMSSLRVDNISFRSWVSLPKYQHGFPSRDSNYITNFKAAQRLNTSVNISSTYDHGAGSRPNGPDCVKFPITDTKHNEHEEQRHWDWWKLVISSDKPAVSVHNISLSVNNAKVNSGRFGENRFQRKVCSEGVSCKMFIDNDKMLHLKNLKNNRRELTSDVRKMQDGGTAVKRDREKARQKATKFCQGTTTTSAQLNVDFPRKYLSPSLHSRNKTSFMQTNNKATLHSRCFYLKTPITGKLNQSDYGMIPSCKCSLCSLEGEMKILEKLGKEDGIINSIHIHLANNRTNDLWSISTSYPSSRPNSLVDSNEQ